MNDRTCISGMTSTANVLEKITRLGKWTSDTYVMSSRSWLPFRTAVKMIARRNARWIARRILRQTRRDGTQSYKTTPPLRTRANIVTFLLRVTFNFRAGSRRRVSPNRTHCTHRRMENTIHPCTPAYLPRPPFTTPMHLTRCSRDALMSNTNKQQSTSVSAHGREVERGRERGSEREREGSTDSQEEYRDAGIVPRNLWTFEFEFTSKSESFVSLETHHEIQSFHFPRIQNLTHSLERINVTIAKYEIQRNFNRASYS